MEDCDVAGIGVKIPHDINLSNHFIAVASATRSRSDILLASLLYCFECLQYLLSFSHVTCQMTDVSEVDHCGESL